MHFIFFWFDHFLEARVEIRQKIWLLFWKNCKQENRFCYLLTFKKDQSVGCVGRSLIPADESYWIEFKDEHEISAQNCLLTCQTVYPNTRYWKENQKNSNIFWLFVVNNSYLNTFLPHFLSIFVSIVVSIPACHAGDRGSIPRQRDIFFLFSAS